VEKGAHGIRIVASVMTSACQEWRER
jgi:hypothetical protein